MRARLWIGLLLATPMLACSSGSSTTDSPPTPAEELPADLLDHDAAHRFAGRWFGTMRLVIGGQSTHEQVALNVSTTGRNAVAIPDICGDAQGVLGRVTSDGDLVLAGRACSIPSDGCTAQWTIRQGAAARTAGPVLTLTLEGPVTGCDLPAGASMRLEFTSERRGFAYLPLPHEVLDAAYDAALDQLVMTDAVTRALYLHDPATGREVSVPLPEEPRCLALSPDGERALVGHAGGITTIDLVAARVLETRPTDVAPGACALAGEWAYLFPADGDRVPRSVQLATHVEPRTPYPGWATSGVLSPDGKALYTLDTTASPPGLDRWDVSSGKAVFAWSAPFDHPLVGWHLWMDRAGGRVFSSTGNAFRIASGQDQDLRDAGRLQGLEPTYANDLLRHLDVGQDEIAAVPSAAGPSKAEPGEPADALDDSRLQRYDPATLARRGAILLPYWLTAGEPLAVHGRYVFHGRDGVLHAIVQADSTAGLPHPWTILHLRGDEPAPVPDGDHGGPIASIAPVAVAAPGVAVGLDGSASADPDGRDLSYAWTVLDGPQGASATFSDATAASPRFTASAEGEYRVQLAVTAADGQRALAAVRIAVTGGALPGLDHAVTEARYSRTLDRIVMTDATIAALFVLDPQSGHETQVPLGAAPSCLSVSPDGRSALVGHPGSLSVVDLDAGVVVGTATTTTDPSDCVLAANGWAYLFPRIDQWEEVHGVDLRTGEEVRSAGSSIWAGARAQLAEDGTAIYSVNRGLSPVSVQRWDITQGTPAQAWQYRSDLDSTATQLWVAGSRIYAGNASWLAVGGALEEVATGGTLSGLGAIQALDATATEVAVVGKKTFRDLGTDPLDTTVELLEPALLGHVGRIALPTWTLGGLPWTTHGRFVFHGARGELYVLVERTEGPPGQWFAVLTL